ncbi:YkvI family membrane protein [Lacicoccus qingdaonensis]|uniref:Uncharacterized membrane protein YkvI n=1 Tax=Lacicoccus qingdaonensis TaxID=576118 RepID=A0A1G9ADC4_9BACL|nr:hypothetical protein [Salinicoccus qingdaonensis]SDK25377.1 Uncharacterized membrane protein YkvI [Salinicoccus qingdaonensis]
MNDSYRRESWMLGFAYAGVVVGAGFSTGQEVLQFFASYGLWSFAGAALAALTAIFIGRQTAKLGYDLDAESHVMPVYTLFGDKFGKVVDYILVFFLYGLGTVMIAGSGATFEQSFNIAPWLGTLFLIVLVSGTLLLDFNKIVSIIGSITPLLVIIVIIVAGYNLLNPTVPLNEVNIHADITRTPTSIWWLDALTYTGAVLACAFSFLSIMGSDASRHKVARRGAVYGGIIFLVLLILVNSSILVTLTQANEVALPTMAMANNLHPVIGTIFSVIILLLIYNSVIGLFYPFLTRFTTAYSRNYKVMLVISMMAAYVMTFVGFVELVNIVYPILGYVGMAIALAIFIRWSVKKYKK